MLEDEFEGRLYKTVWLDNGKVSFSVSQINRTLSDYLVIFWVGVTLYVGWHTFKVSTVPIIPDYVPVPWILAFLAVVVIVVGIIVLICQVSDLVATVPQPNGSRGLPFVRRWCACRRVSAIEPIFLLRRDAPGEGSQQIKPPGTPAD